jgi:PA14 domain
MNRSRKALYGAVAALVIATLAAGAWQWKAKAQQVRAADAAPARWSASPTDLCTARNAIGVGLLGEYFRDANLGGQALFSRLDSVIDFAPGLELPRDQATQSVGSVRWSGWVKAPLTGKYLFHLDGADARVLVSQRLVLGLPDREVKPMEMVAGRFYPVQIELRGLGHGTDRRVRLEWTAPHGARYLIPRALLHQPTEAAAVGRS